MSKEPTEDLTLEIYDLCAGKDVAAVVGASLNILFTALSSVDSPEVRDHFANTLRDMAKQLDDNTESVH